MFQIEDKLVLSARWLLLPVLVYLAGQFLEGPPYRIIVRSVPFILAMLAVSGFAARFASRRRWWPRAFSVVPGLVLPVAFILVLRRYYDGGKNPEFALASGALGLLMGGNLCLYLVSLVAWREKADVTAGKIDSNVIKGYSLKLCRLDKAGATGRVVVERSGGPDLPDGLTLDGFSNDQVIDLAGYWREIRVRRMDRFETEVTIRETIVKFGDTLQLVDRYRLTIESRFA